MENQREIDFGNYEDFYEFFVQCVGSIKGPGGKNILRKEIAFRLGLTQSRFSQRLSPTSENSPRFGLNDLVLYMVTFDDWRPLDYLHWLKKQYKEEKSRGNGKELREIKKQLLGMVSRINGLVNSEI